MTRELVDATVRFENQKVPPFDTTTALLAIERRRDECLGKLPPARADYGHNLMVRKHDGIIRAQTEETTAAKQIVSPLGSGLPL